MKRYQKKVLITILLCIVSIISINAQSRISSVYGVNLGDSEATVATKISGTFKTDSEGNRYCDISRPKLGNCTFDNARLVFKNGRLFKIAFSSSDCGYMDANFQEKTGMPGAYDWFLENSAKYRKMYRRMYTDLTDKYGPPTIDEEDLAIWKSNGNKIELEYQLKDSDEGYGLHDAETYVIVRYLKASSISSNL